MLFIGIKSRIDIYEGGIRGRGTGKWLFLGDIRTHAFDLTYEQISIVRVKHGKLIISAMGSRYTIYTRNARELRAEIAERLPDV